MRCLPSLANFGMECQFKLQLACVQTCTAQCYVMFDHDHQMQFEAIQSLYTKIKTHNFALELKQILCNCTTKYEHFYHTNNFPLYGITGGGRTLLTFNYIVTFLVLTDDVLTDDVMRMM